MAALKSRFVKIHSLPFEAKLTYFTLPSFPCKQTMGETTVTFRESLIVDITVIMIMNTLSRQDCTCILYICQTNRKNRNLRKPNQENVKKKKKLLRKT